MLNKIVTKESYNKTVFIFKHSTRCAISSLAKNRLESDWAKYFNEKEVYFLDLYVEASWPWMHSSGNNQHKYEP